jgi:hypothetical protein
MWFVAVLMALLLGYVLAREKIEKVIPWIIAIVLPAIFAWIIGALFGLFASTNILVTMFVLTGTMAIFYYFVLALLGVILGAIVGKVADWLIAERY